LFVRARQDFSVKGRLSVLEGQSHCQALVCAARRCLSLLGSVSNVKEIFFLTIRLFVNPDFSQVLVRDEAGVCPLCFDINAGIPG
jgi:hypothetical protein